MENMKLLRTDMDTSFILEELQSILNHKHVPEDFGKKLRIEKQAKRYAEDLAEMEERKKDSTLTDEERGMIDKIISNIHEFYHSETLGIEDDSAWQVVVGAYFLSQSRFTDRLLAGGSSSFFRKSHLYPYFPRTIKLLKQIARDEKGYLQRVNFALLNPHGVVRDHIDNGLYFKDRERYHIVLESKNGCEFTTGTEKTIMRERELWWVTTQKIHGVKNLSDTPRIHLIFDLLPYKYRSNIWARFKHGVYSFFFQNYYDLFGDAKFAELIEKNAFLKKVLLRSK